MKNYWLNKRKETTVNPIVNWGVIKFDFFHPLKRDETWKLQLNLMCDEVARNIIAFQKSGHDPMGINFKKIYDKYPKVRVGIRRLLMYVQKHYGIRI